MVSFSPIPPTITSCDADLCDKPAASCVDLLVMSLWRVMLRARWRYRDSLPANHLQHLYVITRHVTYLAQPTHISYHTQLSLSIGHAKCMTEFFDNPNFTSWLSRHFATQTELQLRSALDISFVVTLHIRLCVIVCSLPSTEPINLCNQFDVKHETYVES